VIDWPSVQRAYGDRFGDVFNARTVPDAEGNVLFYLLTFWRPERRDAPVVYATWGAPGRELFLAAVVPYVAFEEILERAAQNTSRPLVAPLDVVTCPGADTPFRGLLVAPAEEGTFSIEVSGGIRPVLRVIPLTPAEREHADTAPREVLDRLRAAGALVADPLRACLLDREHTTRFREHLLNAPVRRLQRAIAELDAEIEEMQSTGATPAQIEADARYRTMLASTLAFFRMRGPTNLEIHLDPGDPRDALAFVLDLEPPRDSAAVLAARTCMAARNLGVPVDHCMELPCTSAFGGCACSCEPCRRRSRIFRAAYRSRRLELALLTYWWRLPGAVIVERWVDRRAAR
jgi:hypothetical protein